MNSGGERRPRGRAGMAGGGHRARDNETMGFFFYSHEVQGGRRHIFVDNAA
jgi:hypothetical protein